MDTTRPGTNHRGKSNKKNKKNGRDKRAAAEAPAFPTPTPEDWPRWQSHLAGRHDPAGWDAGKRGPRRHPLMWGVPGPDRSETLELLVRFLCGRKSASPAAVVDAIDEWAARIAAEPLTYVSALEAIGWCQALVPLAAGCDGPRWLSLFQSLHQLVAEAAVARENVAPVIDQLVAGELAILLATRFPDVPASAALAAGGRAVVAGGITDLLDGEGTLAGAYLESARLLLACWTRCLLTASRDKSVALDDDTWSQYHWFVRRNLSMSRDDGSAVFAPRARDRGLLEAAVELGGTSTDRSIWKHWRKGTRKAVPRPKDKHATVYSEWAEVAAMRCDWSSHSPLAAIEFSGPTLRCELNANGETLWSGAAPVHVVADGELLAFSEPWSEICWFSDGDVDYLELETETAAGWTLQRQMLLARTDRFYYQADVVLAAEPAAIQYETRLPLAPGMRFAEARDTHEGWLVGARHAALVLPLAFPEWREARSPGQLRVEDDGALVLRMNATASALYAPLFVDLDRSRCTRSCTWRRLTVAENRQIVGPDVAAGYRVQAGKHQWLFYRAMHDRGNRTLLGQNVSFEFLAARFKRDGTVKELIEIE